MVYNSSEKLYSSIIVIPVFIGLLFDLLVVVPLRVPVDESPVFLLYQSALLTAGMSSASGSHLALSGINVNSSLESVTNMSAGALTKELLQGNMSTGMLHSDGGSNVTKTGVSVEVLTEALLASLRVSDAATLSIGAPGASFSQLHVKTISRIPTASVSSWKLHFIISI